MIPHDHKLIETHILAVREPSPTPKASAPNDDASVDGPWHELMEVLHEERVLAVVELREVNLLIGCRMRVKGNQPLEIAGPRLQNGSTDIGAIER
jgi:hypothetical protein